MPQMDPLIWWGDYAPRMIGDMICFKILSAARIVVHQVDWVTSNLWRRQNSLLNVTTTQRDTWCWGDLVGLSVGIATLKSRPLGMHMHNWNCPTSPWKKISPCSIEVNIQNADRVASSSMRQHNCVKDDPSGQLHSTFFACQADVGGGSQGNCLASNLNKSVVVKQGIGSGEWFAFLHLMWWTDDWLW